VKLSAVILTVLLVIGALAGGQLLAPVQQASAAPTTIAVNFDGAAGQSCANVLNAEPGLTASGSGPTVINSANAGGSAPECGGYPDQTLTFESSGSEFFSAITFLYHVPGGDGTPRKTVSSGPRRSLGQSASASIQVQLINSISSTIVHSALLTGSGTFSYSGSTFDRVVVTFNGDPFSETESDIDNIVLTLTGGIVGPACGAESSRVNRDPARDCAPPVAVFCQSDGIDIYEIDRETGEGSLLIRLSNEEIDAVGVPVGGNVTLAQVGDVIVSRLTTGEFQVNATAFDGQPYVIIWDACMPTYVDHPGK